MKKKLLIILFLFGFLFNYSLSSFFVVKADGIEDDVIGTFKIIDDNKYNQGGNGHVPNGTIKTEYVIVSLIAHGNPGKKTMDVGMMVDFYTSKPTYINVTITPSKGTTANGVFVPIAPISISPDPRVGAIQTKKIKLDKTWFWNFDVSTTYRLEGGFNKNEKNHAGPVLINRMGRAYPKQVDPGTNQLIAMPVSTLLSKTSTAAATQMRSDFDNRVKKPYRTWWEQTYGGGQPPNYSNSFFGGLFNSFKSPWDGWEIHHIVPIEFGGTNVYSNLVPLPKTKHQEFTTWFAGYYGVNK
ncbi:hypothetical protein [Paenibacillus sp. FSL H3-0469]|uniref:HNH endonuclease signature motif containing protein n=1 Tax=Paenibacillus sp. FSL H3-0469 TaxID=2954506 RepID=UPI0031013387